MDNHNNLTRYFPYIYKLLELILYNKPFYFIIFARFLFKKLYIDIKKTHDVKTNTFPSPCAESETPIAYNVIVIVIDTADVRM